MLENRGGFIPISDANTQKLRIAVPLPEYVNQSEIGVNTKRIERLLRIGGIKHLRVVGQTSDETSNFTPNISGFDAHGNAYAAKAGAGVIVPEHTTEKGQVDDSLINHAALWVDSSIKININEMALRISQETGRSGGVNSPVLWANHLDNAIRRGVSEAGTHHLVWGLDKWNAAAAIFINTSWIASTGNADPLWNGLIRHNFNPHMPNIVGETLPALLFVAACFNIPRYFIFLGINRENGSRFSFFYGPQPDRALLLNTLAKTQVLVKKI